MQVAVRGLAAILEVRVVVPASVAVIALDGEYCKGTVDLATWEAFGRLSVTVTCMLNDRRKPVPDSWKKVGRKTAQ